MNTEKTSLENETKPSCLGAVISRFYAVFSDYGQDFSQRSIWFDNIDKVIILKKEMESRKGKFIILEKSGENGL
jgi:hypothetical protein